MIKKIVFDFSYVLLFAKDKTYIGKLNALNDNLSGQPQYEPLDYFSVNSELLEYLKAYRPKYDFYIFTAGKMHQLPSLKAKLQVIFSNFLSEADVGIPKNNKDAFIKLAAMISTPTSEILFIDDKVENVAAAKLAGMLAIQYLSNDQLIGELAKIL
jgi:FMN phosphatase YigB (HAD superfamily)